MTLIPLMSAIIAAPEAMTAPEGAPALRRESYNPGAGHRPLAATLAIGLPVALVIAVALSPMIAEIAPKSTPIIGTLIEIEKLDPPPPDPQPTQRQATPNPTSPTEVSDPVVPTPPLSDNSTDVGPKIFDPVIPTGDVYVAPVDPPKPAPFVLAKLDARYAGSFQPDYPAREQREGIEGVARVRVLIGADGRVKAVELVSTDSPGFFEETKRRALAKWRFKPATRGGVAEDSWQTMTVRFEIKNA